MVPSHATMDLGISDGGGFGGEEQQHDQQPTEKPRDLPADLPKSLDDRRSFPTELAPETEFYDGWQGPSIRFKHLQTK